MFYVPTGRGARSGVLERRPGAASFWAPTGRGALPGARAGSQAPTGRGRPSGRPSGLSSTVSNGRPERCPEYPCCNGSGVILGAVLRPRIQKNSGGPVVSPSLSSSSPHGERARERTGLPSNAKFQDVEPPSFEYTHCSKEGAKNDAPPNEQRPFRSPIGKGVERRPSGRRLGGGVLPGARAGFQAPTGRGRPSGRPSGLSGADWDEHPSEPTACPYRHPAKNC